MMIETMFAIALWASPENKFPENKNVQNKQQLRKVSKYCKSVIHSVRNVGNDDLNNIHHSWHGAYHWSRNFVKAKMWITNSNFEHFQNTVKVIYTVCAMSEMMISTMFAILSVVGITGVEIS